MRFLQYLKIHFFTLLSLCLSHMPPLLACEHNEELLFRPPLPRELTDRILFLATEYEDREEIGIALPLTLRLVNHSTKRLIDQCVHYPVRAFNIQKFWYPDGHIKEVARGKQFWVEGWVRDIPETLTRLNTLPGHIKLTGHLLGSYVDIPPKWIFKNSKTLQNLSSISSCFLLTLTQQSGHHFQELTNCHKNIRLRLRTDLWRDFCEQYDDQTIPPLFNVFLETHLTQSPLRMLLDSIKEQTKLPFSSALFMLPYTKPLTVHSLTGTLEEVSAVCTIGFQQSMSIMNLASFWMGSSALTVHQWQTKLTFIEKADTSIFGKSFMWENVLLYLKDTSPQTLFDTLHLLEAYKVACPFTDTEMSYLFCALCGFYSKERRIHYLQYVLDHPKNFQEAITQLEFEKGNGNILARNGVNNSKKKSSNEKCIIS